VATREVWAAKQELLEAEGRLRATTGVLKERIEHARTRLNKALEEQRRIQQERDRLVFTLEQAFGVRLGQQSLYPAPREGPRTTFIVRTSQTALRKRIRELRAKLSEAPD